MSNYIKSKIKMPKLAKGQFLIEYDPMPKMSTWNEVV